METFLQPLKKYAVLEGRASRKEFWGFYLMYVLAVFALAFVGGLVSEISGILSSVFVIAIVVLALGALVPFFTVSVRRLHDIGRSGWWLLITFVPFVGGILLLVFYCIPGDKGANEYGADPYNQPAVTPSLPTTQVEPTPPVTE